MLIPVVRLSEPERDDRLRRTAVGDRPIDAADAFPRDARVLAECLLQIAPTGLGPGDPYFITPAFDASAWPRVEVCRAEILSPRLVALVHAGACVLTGADQVEICDALGCLESPFNVFVRRELISVFADESVLKALRLECPAFELA
jgi:hypothetical protein